VFNSILLAEYYTATNKDEIIQFARAQRSTADMTPGKTILHRSTNAVPYIKYLK
jgi:hypothetical protein